ncbi:hypothetical protein [Actinacidiphila oryziradicis]|uniref:Uncharacterized protein n=1 Tax=Actinacidiphila oryziradicis TaxID=2571141 RepID=A0A4V5MX37_9ACTN|nr:hypothetical protein [Actinacidiphila oryziradicis]TJZ98828.1 hypothetical protein FCI23_48035 [Actinacidiphila oryziradicis]
MSEYQYYEFLAVDRPLTEEELRQVRALSTRADITPTRFVNEYHWGDFRGDTTKLVERLYDAHLYYANWGSRRLVLRLPGTVLPAKRAAPYAKEESLSVWTRSGHTLLDFSLSSDDGGEWDFETSYELSAFVGLRAELLAGDLRPLYLSWLAGVAAWELADDDEEEYACEVEPPVPPGLAALTGPQQALADFLNVDADLLAAAAETSAPAAFIAALPATEKDALLLKAVLGTAPQPGPPLLARYRATAPGHGSGAQLRTAAQLLDAAYRRRTEHRQRENEARAAAEEARARAAAEAREAHLDQLARNTGKAWRDIEGLIAQKKPAAYDSAIALLKDLRDIHARTGGTTDFDRRAGELRAAHRGKPALMRRFDTMGIPNP